MGNCLRGYQACWEVFQALVHSVSSDDWIAVEAPLSGVLVLQEASEISSVGLS